MLTLKNNSAPHQVENPAEELIGADLVYVLSAEEMDTVGGGAEVVIY